MSYILSALRKAEAERNGATAAATATPLRPVLDHSPKTRAGLVVAIAVALLILLAGSYYYVHEKSHDRGSATQGGRPPAAAQTPAGSAVASLGADSPSEENNNSANRLEPAANETVAQPGARVGHPGGNRLSNPTPTAEAVAATEVQQQQPAREHPGKAMAPQPLPALNITGYIYFEDKPENSKLFVEGIVYRRHSRLAEGLILEGFYPDHVVVSYRGANQEIKIP